MKKQLLQTKFPFIKKSRLNFHLLFSNYAYAFSSSTVKCLIIGASLIIL
mgnify:CR=1 FL=1